MDLSSSMELSEENNSSNDNSVTLLIDESNSSDVDSSRFTVSPSIADIQSIFNFSIKNQKTNRF